MAPGSRIAAGQLLTRAIQSAAAAHAGPAHSNPARWVIVRGHFRGGGLGIKFPGHFRGGAIVIKFPISAACGSLGGYSGQDSIAAAAFRRSRRNW